MDLALRMGVPCIGINDSGGARIRKEVSPRGYHRDFFYQHHLLVVPQVSIIAGPCAGGAVNASHHRLLFTWSKGTSQMFVRVPGGSQNGCSEDVGFEWAMTRCRALVAHFLKRSGLR